VTIICTTFIEQQSTEHKKKQMTQCMTEYLDTIVNTDKKTEWV